MKAAGGGATAAGLGSLGTAAFSSSASAQASSDDNSFQIDVIEGTTGDIKADPTSASNTYAEDGDLIAYQWGNTAAESEGEGDGSRYLTYSGSSGGTVSSRPTFNIDFNNYTADVTVDVSSGSMDVTVVCYSAANGGTTSNPGFDSDGPQRVVDSATNQGQSGSNTFTVDIPQVNNTNQAAGGYTSIQGAVDAASNGDTIDVEPDVYAEDVDISAGTGGLTVQSTGDFANTIIDINSLFSIEDANTTLDGFTVAKKTDDTLGGIFVDGTGSTISNCFVAGSGNITGGSGAVEISATATVQSNVIENAAVGVRLVTNSDGSTVTDNIIRNNVSNGVQGEDFDGNPIQLNNSSVTGNDITSNGFGIFAEDPEGDLLDATNNFFNNNGTTVGGDPTTGDVDASNKAGSSVASGPDGFSG
jgi:hypothetical protein